MTDRPATVTPQQEAAWRCPRCASKRSVGYGMWPGSGPVKAQCVPCGKVSDWPKIEREGETAERDKPVPRYSVGDGCSCTPHEQDAGGGYTECLLEYEPDCPEHSEHLWDPKQGAWVLRSERDAAVAAEWADHFEACQGAVGPERLTVESMIAALRGPRPFGCEAGVSNADA